MMICRGDCNLPEFECSIISIKSIDKIMILSGKTYIIFITTTTTTGGGGGGGMVTAIGSCTRCAREKNAESGTHLKCWVNLVG